ncbi:MAG: hypothetical protein NTAFB09_25910 [Nitrosospira sp.]
MAEDAISNADDDKNDWIASGDPQNPSWRANTNGENVQRSKLRVDSQMDLYLKTTYNQ